MYKYILVFTLLNATHNSILSVTSLICGTAMVLTNHPLVCVTGANFLAVIQQKFFIGLVGDQKATDLRQIQITFILQHSKTGTFLAIFSTHHISKVYFLLVFVQIMMEMGCREISVPYSTTNDYSTTIVLETQ